MSEDIPNVIKVKNWFKQNKGKWAKTSKISHDTGLSNSLVRHWCETLKIPFLRASKSVIYWGDKTAIANLKKLWGI